MNNIIELNVQRNHRLQNQAEAENALMYMYGDHEEGLVGTLTIVSHLELASIEALRGEIKEQKEALLIGFNRNGRPSCDDELYPWEDHLVCKEGFFIWDWDSSDYVQIR